MRIFSMMCNRGEIAMIKSLYCCIFILLWNAAAVNAEVDWRFGFEWNEGTLSGWNDPKLEILLSRLQQLGTTGGINVNSHSSWAKMQPDSLSDINWMQNDAIVKLFQRYDFSLTWYLTCDAPWAFPDKPDCQPDVLETPFGDVMFYHNCAPQSEFESYWIEYVKAVVERYDGDGIDDMPGLERPIRFYIMPGEIKFGISGTGDEEKGPFWYDTIDNLLRLHRLTYDAVHAADANGPSSVVSSGAVFWDLFADFTDFDPADSGSILQQRLRGNNYRGSLYTAGWDSVNKMLSSFGDDTDGVECDYVGWHPHFSWRIIDQEFALIRHYVDNIPIYVDDMWTNIFSSGYYFGSTIPGGAQFQAQPWPPSDTQWITDIEGDFPNELFQSKDPYHELYLGLFNKDSAVTAWYYANGARNLVKSFVSAFGEGAERASFSGTNDLVEMRNWRWGNIGWINLMEPRKLDYLPKPQYFTFRLLIHKLNSFTTVKEIAVSQDPRTRVYRFERPNGPAYVLWSETGPPPPGLDYDSPNGETVTLNVESDSLLLTRIITDTSHTTPVEETIAAPDARLTLRLGHEPVILEPLFTTDVEISDSPVPRSLLNQNYPNPFNRSTVIEYKVQSPCRVKLTVHDIRGRTVQSLIDTYHQQGGFKVSFDSANLASGVYFYRIRMNHLEQVKKMVLLE